MKCMPEWFSPKRRKLWITAAAFLLLSTALFAGPSLPSASAVPQTHSVPTWILVAQGQDARPIDENLREWQSLSPEEKEQLRRRMQQLNRMEPEDRRHFQRLFEKWQQLSPEERRQIERALDQWDRLSPEEKDSIRRRFRG